MGRRIGRACGLPAGPPALRRLTRPADSKARGAGALAACLPCRRRRGCAGAGGGQGCNQCRKSKNMPRPAARRDVWPPGRRIAASRSSVRGTRGRRRRRGCRPSAHARHAAWRHSAGAGTQPAPCGGAGSARRGPRPKGRIVAPRWGLSGGVPLACRRPCGRGALARPARPPAVLADRFGRRAARRERGAPQGGRRSQGPVRCRRRIRQRRPGSRAPARACRARPAVALIAAGRPARLPLRKSAGAGAGEERKGRKILRSRRRRRRRPQALAAPVLHDASAARRPARGTGAGARGRRIGRGRRQDAGRRASH